MRVTALERDLREIVRRPSAIGRRRTRISRSRRQTRRNATLVVVEALTPDDLRACAARVAAWHEAGLATPLILEAQEFARSLDAFPFEFGAILADHAIVSGANPFERPSRRSGRPAAGVRGAGAQPPAAPARGLHRDTRTQRRARGSHRAIGGSAVGAAEERRSLEAARTWRTASWRKSPGLHGKELSSDDRASTVSRLPVGGRTPDQRHRPMGSRLTRVARTCGSRSLLSVSLFIGAAAARALAQAAADSLPSLTQPVNDFAHVIDAASAGAKWTA